MFNLNEEQIIHGYPIDGAMSSSGAEVIGRLFTYCYNAFVARGILVTPLHCGTPKLHLSAFYIVSSVGTPFFRSYILTKGKLRIRGTLR